MSVRPATARGARAQPAGTVSFLFTDIEGSTRLLQTLGAYAYRAVFDRHRRQLRAAFERHGGYEAGVRGDGFLVAFATAAAAVAAAADAQRALAADESPIRVRMAVHTGEALLDPPDYVGLEVHRAARLMDAAHGGQVLISESTRAALPPGVRLRDLGEHWLRDLAAPQPLCQLLIDDLPSEFPLPRTLHGPRAPLPVAPTRFVGREAELDRIAEFLGSAEVRLLTLTGPGGTGKTRLALAAAARHADTHAGGVHFVALAGISAPDLLGLTLAGALGLQEQPGTDPWELLTAFLSRRDTLLVLDNLEQLLAGVAPLAPLLSACPRLTLLATSRARLGLASEHEFRVPALTEHEATELFVDRADAVAPGFRPDEHVPHICRAVDLLPLAIELAAGRADLLTTAEIAAHLDRRLALLTEGPRDVPARQRTLRATLDWSYELLSPADQRALGELAVFRGGFTRDAAEQVCGAGSDTIQELLESNLLTDAGDRFQLLETVREYGLERSGDPDATAARHADFFLDLAERAAPELRRAGIDRHWLARLVGERDNLRAALQRLVDLRDGPRAHQLVNALWAYWHDVGPVAEAADWFTHVIALPAPDALRARTLTSGAVAAGFHGDPELARARAEAGLDLARLTRDAPTLVIALQLVGAKLRRSGRSDEGLRLLKEALALAREIGDPWLIAITTVTLLSGDHLDADEAVALSAEAAGFQDLGVVTRSMLEFARARTANRAGDPERAIAHYRTSLQLAGEVESDKAGPSMSALGCMLCQRGELEEARELLSEAMRSALEAGSPGDIAGTLANLTLLCAAEGDVLRAARLRGALETYRLAVGEINDSDFKAGTYDGQLDGARAAAGERAWAEAFAAGRELALEDAAIQALRTTDISTTGSDERLTAHGANWTAC